MNPACRLNLNGPECQKWLTAVSSHCGSLLPKAELASLWDSWWPDELPAPYKAWVSTLSAFDCHKLRKEVANQLDESLQTEANSHSAFRSFSRWPMALLVLLMVLMAMLFALKMVIKLCRERRSDVCSSPSPTPKTSKAVCIDEEAPLCQTFMNPRSFVSFGQHSDPLPGYGLNIHQNPVKANSIPDVKPKEQ
ncbi:hypothetical protein KR059_008686, partial [Drosophila kikkawai]